MSGDRPRLRVVSSPEPGAASGASFEPLSVAPAASRFLYEADAEQIFRLLATSQFDDPYLAFRELYANALDAVRAGGSPRIDISVSPTEVVIHDQGVGLDAPSLEALTTLGRSTRRGTDAIGRFGMGFVSVFDPALGVETVTVLADRSDAPGSVRVEFVVDDGRVTIRVDEVASRREGTSVAVRFQPERAGSERATRTQAILQEQAAYSGVETYVNGKRLARSLDDYVEEELRAQPFARAERALAAASVVRGPLGVAAIDPARAEATIRVHHRGLFVRTLTVPRPSGRPWIRGAVGAVHAEGLRLVASRNDFIHDDRFAQLESDVLRLVREAAYRVVQCWESRREPYARLVLVDAIRRGLRTATPEEMIAEADDLFSSAVIRAPLFRSWSNRQLFGFETLVELARRGEFYAQSFRPGPTAVRGMVFRADDSNEREIFRKVAGAREMPAVARAEVVARPGLGSRLIDRFLAGPRSEYSLFRTDVPAHEVPEPERRLLFAVDRFLARPAVVAAVGRLIAGPMPSVGFGASSNVFGPVAAYREGEIRLNLQHRAIRRLARAPDPDLAVVALLPVLAHELAHACHELHDADFYRTSRTLLRSLVSASTET